MASVRGVWGNLAMLLQIRFFTILVFLAVSYGVWVLGEGLMLRFFLAIIPALFALQVFLNDVLELYLTVQLNVRSRWFTLLIAPGTVLHELCHLSVAVVTGCKITDVSLFRRNPTTNVLGYVAYRQPADSWSVFRDLVIGFAPFFGCGLLLLLVFGVIEANTPLDLLSVPKIGVGKVDFGELAYYIYDLGMSFLKQFSLLSVYPWLWILLYLELCFSLGSAPSGQDFKGTLKTAFWHPISLLFLMVLCFGFLYLTENLQFFGGYEESFREGVLSIFNWIVLVQLASVAMLILSMPLIYFIPEIAEIRGVKKYLPVVVFIGLFYGLGNLIYALGGFLAAYALVKWPGMYLR